jgi:hypothetical protein
MRLTTLLLLVMGCAGSAMASVVAVPEIDANTGLAALTIISGGLLILRGRRRRK